MQSHPDVQLGKIFIVGCIAMMLFIIILVFVVYINAKNETANCNAPTTITTKSKEQQNGRTPIFFIVFIAISFLVVSTMNLTYKVNYFTKKAVDSESGPESPVLAMIKNSTESLSLSPSPSPSLSQSRNTESSNNKNE